MINTKRGIILSLIGMLFLISCNRHFAAQKQVKPSSYVCPMHTIYVTNQPGKCPQCGVALVSVDQYIEKLGQNNSLNPGQINNQSGRSVPSGGGHSGHIGH